MVDTAARLIDEVLPPVPVRQWVLSLPFEIRYRLAWDGKLVSAVLAVFLRVVYGWYRRQAKGQGHDDGRCGSVSFVQRFGSALNLNPHFHVLMPDGVYVTGHDGTPRFVRTPQLTEFSGAHSIGPHQLDWRFGTGGCVCQYGAGVAARHHGCSTPWPANSFGPDPGWPIQLPESFQRPDVDSLPPSWCDPRSAEGVRRDGTDGCDSRG